jgi:hypothetical protein
MTAARPPFRHDPFSHDPVSIKIVRLLRIDPGACLKTICIKQISLHAHSQLAHANHPWVVFFCPTCRKNRHAANIRVQFALLSVGQFNQAPGIVPIITTAVGDPAAISLIIPALPILKGVGMQRMDRAIVKKRSSRLLLVFSLQTFAKQADLSNKWIYLRPKKSSKLPCCALMSHCLSMPCGKCMQRAMMVKA